jgi:hypothetical protein
MKLKFIFNICSTFLLVALYNPVIAKDIKKEQRNIGNWITYIEKKSNKKICYTYSNPVEQRLFYGKREKPYFNINYLGDKKFTITVYPGYNILNNLPMLVNVENHNIKLDTSQYAYAITYNSAQDMYLINLLIKSTQNYFYVKSYKEKKNISVDYYSLSGFVESLKYLQNNCK